MNRRWSVGRGVLWVYVALVLVAALVGGVRLRVSSEMPGLAALELLLLALPWSLALGVEPFSRLGWGGIASILLCGVALVPRVEYRPYDHCSDSAAAAGRRECPK
jgi:hypothetical protein